MISRPEYEEIRNRNRSEASDGAMELRDALVRIPALERVRLLADNPQILARLPSVELRAEVLVTGTALTSVAEQAVAVALAESVEPEHHAAALAGSLMPRVSASVDMPIPPKRRHIGPHGLSPRHRINDPWARSWHNLGRAAQAAVLALAASIGIDGWNVYQAASVHDSLPPSATFRLAGTWPQCSEGLRAKTDFCVYSVAVGLDWPRAMAALQPTEAEEHALRSVNKPLLENDDSWMPESLLVVWRGKKPMERQQ